MLQIRTLIRKIILKRATEGLVQQHLEQHLAKSGAFVVAEIFWF